MRPNDWRVAKMPPKKTKTPDKDWRYNEQRPHNKKVLVVVEEEDVQDVQRHQKDRG